MNKNNNFKIIDIIDLILYFLILIACFFKGITINGVFSITLSLPFYRIVSGVLVILTSCLGVILTFLFMSKKIDEKYEFVKLILNIINIIVLLFITFRADSVVSGYRYVDYNFEIGYYLIWILSIVGIVKYSFRNNFSNTKIDLNKDKKYHYNDMPPMT